MLIDLINGYEGRSKSTDTARRVNLYAEINTQGSKNRASLVATPGTKAFSTNTKKNRGLDEMNEVMYAVKGDTFYEVSNVGVETSRGTLATSSGRVSITNNGTQMLIVDGTEGYVYTPSTTTFTQINRGTVGSEGFPLKPQHVDFIDGFFICNFGGTGKFAKSGAYDGIAWDALEFATSEGDPDNLVTLITDHREVWLLNAKTSEVWYNSGAADFPFERINGAFMEYGCIAQWSVAKSNNTIFWLGQSYEGGKTIWKAQGYQPVRVSNHAVEYAIDSYSRTDDAYGFSYTEEGHSFYILSFPTEGKTWVYDSSVPDPSLAWHERSSEKGMWLAHSHVWVYGDHYVSDYRNGNIYNLSHTAFDESGEEIIRDVYTNHLYSEGDILRGMSVELDCERGVGLVTGQGSDPQAMLRISKDGGNTWGPERWRSMGKIGKYKPRVKWNRLGRARDAVFHLRISDPVKTIINALVLK